MKSIVADNLSNIIKEKCLKQCTVAEKAGYSKQQLTDMLKGRKRIKETDILRLASALDVDVSVLLKTEADSNEAGDKQREKERPDVRAFVKLLKIEDGYAVCDVRFKVVKPDEEQEVTDR
nr:MAG TPA: helix-turn-helix domain protein [Caudoviricetes sp.]